MTAKVKTVWKKLLTVLLVAGLLVFSACAAAKEETSATSSASSETSESAKEEASATSSASSGPSEPAKEEAASEAEGAEADAGSEEELPADAESAQETASSGSATDLSEAPEIPGLTVESALPLDYATCFRVFYYTDGYKVIDVPLSATYLVVPEGAEVPEGISSDIVILREPFDSIYLAATSAMALFGAIDSIDKVTMSGTSEGNWYIDAPMKALKSGEMVYAGKYSEPDYETMIALDCDLAIESTMILHTPEVQEMIEDLDIPVFIDRSAYETGPLGRTEWVKLYGALMEKDEEANAFFAEQKAIIDALEDFENTGKTVAYFSVNTNGQAVVRTNNDYIPAMIDLAGGKYLFDGMFPEDTASTRAISMEQFYSVAHEADFLVYNATIEEALPNVDALIGKDEVFADFKAVEEGNVWQVDKTAYQSTDKMANLILDFNIMLTDGDKDQLTFLSRLE